MKLSFYILLVLGLCFAQEVKRIILYDDGIFTETYLGTDTDLEEDNSTTPDLFSRGFFGTAIRKAKEITNRILNKTAQVDDYYINNAVNKVKKRLQLIYPGTKWCGDGDKAKDLNDLGTFEETDKCCRAHDKCPANIEAKKTNYNLTNNGLFTRSHCNCDTEFYDCLKAAKEASAFNIGFTYFTLLGPKCFKEDFEIIRCDRYSKGKCIEYKIKESGYKTNQWFDSPPYL